MPSQHPPASDLMIEIVTEKVRITLPRGPRRATPRHREVEAHAEPISDWAPVVDLDARRSA